MVSVILRQKAEDLLKNRSSKTHSQFSEADMLKYIHELEVHQVELEIQNEELLLAKASAQDAIDLYDFAPIGYFTLSSVGEIKRSNFSGAAMLGREPSLLKDSSFGFFISEGTKPVFNQFLERIFNGKIKETCELILENNDNMPIFVELTGIMAEKGEYCFVTMVNITARKQEETREKYYAALLENVDDAIVASDERFRLTIWNKAAELMYGWKAEEVFGQIGLEITRTQFPESNKNSMLESIAVNGYYRGEATQVRRNGERFPVDISSIAIRDSYGHIAGYVSINRDITQRKLTENAIKKSEERYRDLFENSFMSILIIDSNGIFQIANNNAAKQFGLAPELIAGKSLFELLPYDVAQKYLQLNQELIESGGQHEYEDSFMMNGEQKTFLIVDRCIFNEYGVGYAVQSTSIDITHRKQMENALLESEANLSAVFNATDESILLISADESVITSNELAANRLGLTRSSLIGQKIFDLLPNEVVEHRRTFLAQAVATGEPVVFEDRRNDRWMTTHIFPIRDLSGKVTRTSIFARDVTEKRLADQQMREIYKKLELAMELANMAWWEMDVKTGNVSFHKRKAEMLGYAPEKFKHYSDFMALVHPGDHEKLMGSMLAHIKGATSRYEGEYRILNQKGDYLWLYVIGSVNQKDENDKPLTITGLVIDITGRKQAETEITLKNENLQQLNATKDKFFSIIAHDLKSPFNAIMGFSDLLVEQVREKDYEGIDEYAGYILQSSKRAMDLLTNLMEWSRSQTGRMDFNPGYFEMVHLINNITPIFDGIAKQKSISLKKKLPHNISVFADKEMVSTIIRNLISNAIKFTQTGGEITLTVKSEQNGVLVSVNDSGIGIPAKLIGKLFRIDRSYSTPGTNKEQGTGLGLILCKEFIEMHGGKIWVESEEGKGSTFYFTLPDKSNE